MTLPTRSTYHHGDLRHVLMDAAERLLAEGGPDGFSLREVARRAGVSPAAPAHHFGDVAGLLSAVSQSGFEALTAALLEGERRAGPRASPRERLVGQGVGYVAFAVANPGKFRQMFRGDEPHDGEMASSAGSSAYAVLKTGICAVLELPAGTALDFRSQAALLSMWSLVHGFAHLAIAGRLAHLSGGARLDAWTDQTLPVILHAAINGMVGTGASAGTASR